MLTEKATERLRAALAWATQQADGNMDARSGGDWNQKSWGSCLASELSENYREETGRQIGDVVWDVAEAALEVGPYGDEGLFDGANTLGDLWEIAGRLTGGAIVAP